MTLMPWDWNQHLRDACQGQGPLLGLLSSIPTSCRTRLFNKRAIRGRWVLQLLQLFANGCAARNLLQSPSSPQPKLLRLLSLALALRAQGLKYNLVSLPHALERV